MADFGSPVASGIKPPDPEAGMRSLSSLMGLQQKGIEIQRSQQALETGKYTQQQEQGKAQHEQQLMAERQAMQKMHQTQTDPDGNRVFDDKGEPIPDKLAAAYLKHFPLMGQAANQAIIKTMDDRLKLHETVRGLGQNYRNDLSGIARSAIGTQDGPEDISAKLDAYGKQNPDAAPAIERAKSLVKHLNPSLPQARRDQALLHLAQEFQPSGTTVQEQAPKVGSHTSPSGDLQLHQENPLSPVPTGNMGQQMPQGIPPQVVTPPGGIPTGYKGGGQAGAGVQGPAPTNQDWANHGAYEAGLSHRVAVASDLLPRIKQATQALDKIKTGGGAETRAAAAKQLQAIPGVPQSLIDRVAGGDLAATQEAQKYLFQTTFSGLKQSMQGDTARVAEFNAAEQIFPTIGTDPKATKRILQFMEDQGNRDFAEQQALLKSRKEGTFNPVTWQGDYQASLRKGKVPGVPDSQVPAGERTATMSEVEGYAKKHGISVQEAKDHLTKHGVKIK